MTAVTGPVGIIANPYSRLMRGSGLVEALSTRVAKDRVAVTERAADAGRAVRDLVDAGARIIGIAGGDGTFSSVVTASIRYCDAAALPTFLPLRAGAWNHVANSVRVRGEPLGILDRSLVLLSRGRLQEQLVPTLRVSSSTRAAPDYGFNFFVGALYHIVEEGHRRGPARRHTLAALAAAFAAREGLDTTPLRIIADEQPLPAADSAWLSVADESGGDFFDISLGSGKALAGYFEFSRALMKPWSSGSNRRTRRAVLQLTDGYVLDGDLFPADQPYVCSISRGPGIKIISDIRKTSTRLLTN